LRHSVCSTTIAAYAASAALSFKTGLAYSLGRSETRSQACSHGLKLLTMEPYVARPSLPFSGLHLRNPCKYIDYYSFIDPKGMKG